jgi:hypothetical protein
VYKQLGNCVWGTHREILKYFYLFSPKTNGFSGLQRYSMSLCTHFTKCPALDSIEPLFLHGCRNWQPVSLKDSDSWSQCLALVSGSCPNADPSAYSDHILTLNLCARYILGYAGM